jgi:hypothetical protein
MTVTPHNIAEVPTPQGFSHASVARGDAAMSETDIPEWWQPYASEYPAWHAFKGVNMLCYARIPRTSPPIIVRGESPEDLRDEIRREEAKRGIGRYAP